MLSIQYLAELIRMSWGVVLATKHSGFICSSIKHRFILRNSIPALLRVHQTLIFGQNVEESKRTLKNPFALRLAEFNTTLKLPRITDQWYIVPVKFRFGRNLDFLALLLLPLAGGPKDWKHFDADWRLISSASFHTSSDNCERNTQKWNSNNFKTVRKKPLRHWCDWGDLVEGSFAKQNVLQRHVSKLLNEPPYGRQNQTNRRYMFRKTSAMKS